MREVRIIAQSSAIDITVPMGDGPATITAGLGGWQSIDRVDDLALTDWSGQAPLEQDVPLILDGFTTGDSVERELTTLFKLARDFSGEKTAPPVFKVFGPVFFEGKSWVLPEGGLELDTASTIRRDDGELLRQALTLHLLEFVKPDVLKERKKHKGIGRRPGPGIPVAYSTRQGDTFEKIAGRIYGDPSRWREIAKKNPKYPLNPWLSIPAGRTLNL